ncbi:hypothetical protein AN641_03645 [Candidatus Epulonipiscioides gigas]|nr:hypothetical protein AN641_03645 [Epulopiscium sp. SCG-C07WGA-EpuloA2]
MMYETISIEEFSIEEISIKEISIEEFIDKIKWCFDCSGEIEISSFRDYTDILVDEVNLFDLSFEGNIKKEEIEIFKRDIEHPNSRYSICLSEVANIRIILFVNSYTETVKRFAFEICDGDSHVCMISLEGEVR